MYHMYEGLPREMFFYIIHSFIHSSIHSFIHSFIHQCMCHDCPLMREIKTLTQFGSIFHLFEAGISRYDMTDIDIIINRNPKLIYFMYHTIF